MTVLGPQVSNYLNTGADSPRVGNSSPALIPTAGVFTTADGFIMVTCLTDGQFKALAPVVNRLEWLTDPLFADFNTRKANYDHVEQGDARSFQLRQHRRMGQASGRG